MNRMNGLSDELLIKILSYVPTKVAVSTSILSKRWEFLWMWLSKLEYNEHNDITHSNCLKSSLQMYQHFISKNLPLHRAPIIESLNLIFGLGSVQPKDIKLWVGIAVSRCVRELSLDYIHNDEPEKVLPSSLYTCKSLVTLKLDGADIFLDVTRTGCLPSLKNLLLQCVTYSDENSLRLLLSYCPVLEDLVIERGNEDDSGKALVVMVPSLQRLSLKIGPDRLPDGYVIVTPSLKYFKIEDERGELSYLIKDMPKLEEADIVIEQGLDEFLGSIISVKRLSLNVYYDHEQESRYRAGIVFNQLEHLKLCLCYDNWSKLLVRLLKDSPKLRVLSLYVEPQHPVFKEYKRITWSNEPSSVPKCLLKSLETFEFVGYKGREEERDFLSFIFKNARCLKSPSILS